MGLELAAAGEAGEHERASGDPRRSRLRLAEFDVEAGWMHGKHGCGGRSHIVPRQDGCGDAQFARKIRL